MRLVTAARRTVALTAATALITAGGVVTGALTGIASAEELQSVTYTGGGANNGVKHFTITSGSTQFYPSGQDEALLRHNPVLAGQPDIIATNVAAPGCSGPLTPPNANCGKTLTFDADLSNAAPGSYDVIATATALAGMSTRDFSKANAVAFAAESAPVVDSSALYTTGATPPDGQLTISGDFLAKASTVTFVDATNTVDPKLTFTPLPGGYVNKTTLRGTYTIADGFVPGVHHIRVTNYSDESGTATAPFYQPKIASTTPTPLAIGQGAQGVPFTFTGTADHVFNPDSTLFINANGAGTKATDITVSTDPVVDSAGKVVTTALSASATATTGMRSITVRGADGGYTRLDNALTVTAAPTITSLTPSSRGQGFAGNLTVVGTNLSASSVFDFGPGITATNAGSTGPTNATVAVTIAGNATLGARSVKVTNADGGTTTKPSAFTVTAAPVISSITPGSNQPNTTGSVTLVGSGFAASGATLTASSTGVTFGAPTGSATQLTATYTIASDAAFGPRDVTITNPDGGTSTCTSCFGVSNLTVIGSPKTNGGTQTIKLVSNTADPLSMSSTVTVSFPAATDQGDLPGTATAFDSGTGQLTVTVPLSDAAVGNYNVKAVTGTKEVSCTGCLKVLASASPAFSSLEPNNGGQGAVSRTLLLTGTAGIYPGQSVTFSGTGITTKSTTYQGDSVLKVVVDIASDATLGARDVTVANTGDPSNTTTFAGKFTVTAAPTITTVAPATVGQGGVVDGTITGTLFQEGATVSVSGTGVTAAVKDDPAVTATSIPVTFTVGESAATGPRDVTVVNADGGRATKVGVLEITPAPVISAFSPAQLPAGASNVPLTITGTGFHTPADESDTTKPVITPGGQLTFGDLVVNEDGTSITTTVSAAAGATEGKPIIQITNPDGGTSKNGDAAGETGLVIATPPAAPPVVVVPGDTQVTVAWSLPTSRTSVTEYTVERTQGQTSPVVTVVTAPTRFLNVTGLQNGLTYQFRVKASNTGAGYGPYSAPVNATPKYATKLTSTVTTRSSRSGQSVCYTGKLTRVTGNVPLAGKVIKLTLRPAVGAAKTVQVPTKSDGTWNYSAIPTYNTTVSTVSVTDAVNAAAAAPTYAESVAVRVTITAPAAGSTSGSATTLVVRGKVSPNKAGRTIGVYKLTRSGYVGIASTTVRSDGTYGVNVRLPRGDYYIRTGVAAYGGNATGYSAPLLIHRR
jgi:hypothetical protein